MARQHDMTDARATGEAPEALILAGGLGTRLRPVLPDVPKVLAEVGGRAFIRYLLAWLRLGGVTDAVLCVGHLAGAVEAALGGQAEGVRLRYSREVRPLGTAGALRLAVEQTRGETLLALNGDSFIRAGLRRFLGRGLSPDAKAMMLLRRVGDVSRFGSVTLGRNGEVAGFMEKSASGGPGLVNAGVYLMRREVLASLPEGREISLEREVFPALAGRGLYGRVSRGAFLDIGEPDSLAAAQAFFTSQGASHAR